MKYLKKILLGIACIASVTYVASGCSNEDKDKVSVQGQSEAESATAARHNEEDMVIITAIDEQKSQISVQSLDTGKVYVLNYTSGTSIKNKYDTEVLLSKIGIGEIANVYYVGGTQKLIALEESKEAWENSDVTKWDAQFDENLFSIGGENYKYDGNLFVISGKKEIDIKNISGVDTLVVRGIGNKIYSINVKTGHGYIKLTDTTNFIDGMVDVGGKIMTVIKADMIIAAPEGEHTLTAWKNGSGGSVTVNVERDSEISVSLSGFNSEVIKNGAVKFNIQPSTASYTVFIDDKEVDASAIVELEYGTHTIRISSDKYEDYTEKFVVNSIYMNKTINFESDSSVESSTQKETETEKQTTGSNKLTITAPEGASVYMDGNFVGTIPLTTEKVPGDHVIILRQTGYSSMVYNMSLSDDTNDVTLFFPAMEKE